MSFFKKTRNQYFIVFAMAVLLYANTIKHGFVMDDDVVIVKNTYVQKGLQGIVDIFTHDSFAGYGRVGEGSNILEGGRYRPLSLAFFALLHSLFGTNPLAFHLFNILLYACCSVLLLRVLKLMWDESQGSGWIPFLTTLLFVSHPIHTEVVANVKSVDEILALTFGLGALFGILRSADNRSLGWMAFSGITFLLACLAKESAVTFVIIAPLALWYFKKKNISNILLHSIPLIAGLILYLVLRNAVLGDVQEGTMMNDPLNQPFLEWNGQRWEKSDGETKTATIIYTLGQYIRLMIVPFPLTHDYYPFHIQLQSFSNPIVIFILVLVIAMLLYAIWSLKTREPAGFGLIWFLGTLSLTLNILFSVGTFMAERFLFLPSVGFILAVVIFVFKTGRQNNNSIKLCGLGIVIVIFSILTVWRNNAWKSNESLFRTDINHSPNSAKLRNNLGTLLLDQALQQKDALAQKALLQESFQHLEKAIELHPTYYDAFLAYGACAYYLGDYYKSVEAYRRQHEAFPGDEKSRTGLWYALQAFGRDQWTKGDTSIALLSLEEAWALQPDTSIAIDLSKYYQILGNKEKEEEWNNKEKTKISQ